VVVQCTSHDVEIGWRDGRGFSLLEALVALALLGSALAALAQLVVMATEANVSARATTLATALAIDKMEQLKGQGADLRASPPGSLRVNSEGYCDFFDGAGRLLGGGAIASSTSVYVRRWAVEVLPSDPENARVLQVRVIPQHRVLRPALGWPGAVPADASGLVALRTRKDR
jgi:prepilin-type N-terminal cleavage/methylation domain-containing protein